MASVVKRPNGHKWVQFFDDEGRRKTLRLGKASIREANAFNTKVEQLLSAQAAGIDPSVDVVRWLDELPDKIHERIIRCGLASRMLGRDVPKKLGEFIDWYIANRPAKPKTKEK